MPNICPICLHEIDRKKTRRIYCSNKCRNVANYPTTKKRLLKKVLQKISYHE